MGFRDCYKYLLAALLAMLLLPMAAGAQEIEPEKHEKIDVKSIVFGHLADSYDWHITDWGEKHISIPLPVIVRGKTTGWDCFWSTKVAHGHTHNGFYIATEGKYKDKLVQLDSAGAEVRPLDISLTKNALSLLISSALLIWLVLGTARWYKSRPGQVPGGLRGLVEMTTAMIVDDVIEPCIGKDYKRFAPYLLTAFFFILINNFLGLIPIFPGGANVTGNIAVTMVLALFTFVIINVSGTREYWKEIFWPDVPVWLKVPVPMMPAIELFGVFTKPFALMIRLFANIMAGHAMILGLTCVIFVTASMGPAIHSGMSVLSVVFVVFMSFVELLVGFIQAYVFTMLSAVFIGLARVEPHKTH